MLDRKALFPLFLWAWALSPKVVNNPFLHHLGMARSHPPFGLSFLYRKANLTCWTGSPIFGGLSLQ